MSKPETEQAFQQAIRKIAAKYQAIVTMVNELQDNLNALIGTSYALLKEKDDKIRELQAPVKESVKLSEKPADQKQENAQPDRKRQQ